MTWNRTSESTLLDLPDFVWGGFLDHLVIFQESTALFPFAQGHAAIQILKA